MRSWTRSITLDKSQSLTGTKSSMRFNLKHLFAFTAVIGLLLSIALMVFSPFIRGKAAQRRIINNIDHRMIRDSVLPLLENSAQRFIEPDDWPECVAMTEPKTVYIANGQVFIEYGGGFVHYGLVIDPNNQQQTDRKKLINGVYFYETE